MFERIAIIVLSLTYLGVFIARNLVVKAQTGQKIRSQDGLLLSAIVLSALSICVTILSAWSMSFYRIMVPLKYIRHPFLAYAGLVFWAASILMGWMVSAQLKDSWRVGVHEDQKTELVQDGIYAHIRNPYFLTYYVMFLSLFLVRPSVTLLGLLLATITLYHQMVLKEERFLSRMHGQTYLDYVQKTGRYLPRCT